MNYYKIVALPEETKNRKKTTLFISNDSKNKKIRQRFSEETIKLASQYINNRQKHEFLCKNNCINIFPFNYYSAEYIEIVRKTSVDNRKIEEYLDLLSAKIIVECHNKEDKTIENEKKLAGKWLKEENSGFSLKKWVEPSGIRFSRKIIESYSQLRYARFKYLWDKAEKLIYDTENEKSLINEAIEENRYLISFTFKTAALFLNLSQYLPNMEILISRYLNGAEGKLTLDAINTVSHLIQPKTGLGNAAKQTALSGIIFGLNKRIFSESQTFTDSFVFALKSQYDLFVYKKLLKSKDAISEFAYVLNLYSEFGSYLMAKVLQPFSEEDLVQSTSTLSNALFIGQVTTVNTKKLLQRYQIAKGKEGVVSFFAGGTTTYLSYHYLNKVVSLAIKNPTAKSFVLGTLAGYGASKVLAKYDCNGKKNKIISFGFGVGVTVASYYFLGPIGVVAVSAVSTFKDSISNAFSNVYKKIKPYLFNTKCSELRDYKAFEGWGFWEYIESYDSVIVSTTSFSPNPELLADPFTSATTSLPIDTLNECESAPGYIYSIGKSIWNWFSK